MKRRGLIMAAGFGVMTLAAGWTFSASDLPAPHEAPAGHQPAADPEPHPVLSSNGSWAGVMMILILGGFFLPAAVIGPIVRALTPEEIPPAHSHDEPPGSSGTMGGRERWMTTGTDNRPASAPSAL